MTKLPVAVDDAIGRVFKQTPTETAFYKLLAARLVSNVGDSLYTVAAMWLVFEFTGSTVFTGLAGFLARVPPALQFLLGPIVDRSDLSNLLVSTQAVQAVLVLIVPVAAYLDTLSVWVIITLIPILSFINQFVYPAQNSALPRIVQSDQLARANSMFDVAYRGTNVLFNAMAGAAITVFGAISVYVIDSATFVVATVLFVSTTIPPADEGDTDERDQVEEADASDSTLSFLDLFTDYVADLRDGMGFVRGSLLIHLLLVAAVANFTIGITRGILPAYAGTRGGAGLYGLLVGALGAGMLIGSGSISFIDHVDFGWATIVGFLMSAVVWLVGAGITRPALLGVALGAAFVPVGAFNVVVFTAIQKGVPNDSIGRVTSLVVSAGAVSLPLGMVAGGLIADASGVVPTVRLTGLGFAFVAAYFAAKPRLRHLPAVSDINSTHLLE
jgi:hypothetical protein